MDFSEEIRSTVKSLPHDPGIYRFYNTNDVLIYVGKAKNLKKRVASYFSNTSGHSRKTLKLVSEIRKIDYSIVESEFDALLLENNLIKQNQPKYNILLKDDKSFPFICITNERFPRVFSTRRLDKKRGKFYGPYTSVVAMNNVLDLLKKLYTIRDCRLNLSEQNVKSKKYSVCLEYHLGNCKGPCVGLQQKEDYDNDIIQVKNILKGKLSVVKNSFKSDMDNAAIDLDFEKAEKQKSKLDLLERFKTKTIIINPEIGNIHVLSIISDEKHAYLGFMIVSGGTINFAQTIKIQKQLEESNSQLMKLGLFSLTTLDSQQQYQLIANRPIDNLPDNISVSIPERGDKKKLLDLCTKNALELKRESLSQSSQLPSRELRVLNQLRDDLRLNHVPDHIECFDNSNLQGTNPVASMVCFKNGKPSKSNYRKFNVKTIVGPDDFGSMKEIVFRRYKRLTEEQQPLPNLIVVDGGKGQLSAACEALKELDIYGQIPIIGIAKRLEELYFPGDTLPLFISKKSESLKLIQQLRDEAHRFAITFHRNKRSKQAINSALTEIKGIGPQTSQQLLSKFKSVKKIKEASIQELSAIVGAKKAETIKSNL